MPDPNTTPTAPAQRPPDPASKGFQSPDFLKKLEAGFANSAALAAGQTPSVPTDSPDDNTTSGATPPNAAGAVPQQPPAAPGAAAPDDESATTHTADKPADPPGGKRSSKDWDALRTKHREELASLRSQIEELKKGGPSAELDALRKQRDELKSELDLIAVERNPDFRRQWDQKTKDAIERLKAVSDDKGDVLVQIAHLPNGKHRDRLISEALGELPGWKQAEIGSALADLSRLSSERTAMIERTKQTLAQQAAQADAERLARAQAESAMFDRKASEWRDALEQLAEGDTTAIDTAISIARNAFTGKLPADQLAQFSMWGGVGPLLVKDSLAKVKTIEAKDAEIAALKAENAALRGHSPMTASTATSDAPTGDGDTKPPGMSFGERAALQAIKAGAVSR